MNKTVFGKSMRVHLLVAFRLALSPLSHRLHILVDAEATKNKMLIEWASHNDPKDITPGLVLINIHENAVREYTVEDDRVSFYCKRNGETAYVSIHVDDIIGVVHPIQGWIHPLDTSVVCVNGTYALMQEHREGSDEPPAKPEPIEEAKPRPTLRIVK